MGETKTQKEFKRAIKELENDGYTFKNPRTRTVRFEDKKSAFGRYSIGGAIFILWNIFAISTWVLPRFGIYPMQYFQQPSVFTNQIPGIASPINTPQKNATIGSNCLC
ncbi:hypothetical protein [Anoxynatronum buryatiense]|uniref:Uncharacterized protein n=1 Tax=Anoxynatronum buryatiense TaxID=489973 RepID=A0AA45WWZ9_9CLOT|nr:hypothetical protein [Anoxynatronum buryatiense]SMP62476.1 hypothetical protein SAMN06296020_1101 [Anoxynatronum buryatiense]